MSEHQSTNTVADFLTSLASHLREHHLDNTMTTVTTPRSDWVGALSVYPWGDLTRLGVFAAWLPTLRDAAPSVWGFSDGRDREVHLRATGTLSDGTAIEVRVIVQGDEFDLLSARTPLVKDAPIEVDLLLSLVSAQTAEHTESVSA